MLHEPAIGGPEDITGGEAQLLARRGDTEQKTRMGPFIDEARRAHISRRDYRLDRDLEIGKTFEARREKAECSGAGALLPVSMPETSGRIADLRLAAHEQQGGGTLAARPGIGSFASTP